MILFLGLFVIWLALNGRLTDYANFAMTKNQQATATQTQAKASAGKTGLSMMGPLGTFLGSLANAAGYKPSN